MTTISSTTARSRALDGFVARFAALANSIATYLLRREAIKALRALDDRRLSDIGLSRCDIEAAVRGAAHPDTARPR